MSKISYLIINLIMISLISDRTQGGINETGDKKVFDFKKQTSPQMPLIIDRKKLDVNRISAWFRNDGEFHSDHSTQGPGFEWPKGGGVHAIFSSGLWIGAKVITDKGKDVRVATVGHFGSEYRPGRIMPDGNEEDFTLPHLRIYQVNPVNDRANTNKDYAEWPIDQGAPWIDIDGNGRWDPKIDRIGIKLPEGTLYPDIMQFYVYNDNNPVYHTSIWGASQPLGVEIRQTNWAYQYVFPDVQFIRFQIYNKSNNIWDSTYIAIWSDPDIGNAFDDYVGCDTTTDRRGKKHNLGYAYNGDNNDEPGYGIAPPAVGYKLLQGPLIKGNPNDIAIAFGKKWIGYKNGNISAFNFFCNPGHGGCTYPEPIGPEYYIQTYYMLMGLKRSGRPQIDCNGDTTKIMLAGDPVTGTGCLNSHFMSPTDMRFLMTVGPLTLAPGDSQEVVYAALIDRGNSYLNSITRLRQLSEMINFAYEHNFQNIPVATIKYRDSYLPPILVNANIKDALQVEATLINRTGEILVKGYLYDDGAHSDSLADDGIWGNWLYPDIDSTGASLDLKITYKNNQTLEWNNVVRGITICGRLVIDATTISDNINNNGIPNPGENIRLKLKIKNESNYNLNNISAGIYKVESNYILNPVISNYIFVETLPINNISDWLPDKFISFDIDKNTPVPHIAKLILLFFDNKENYWLDTISLTIQQYQYQPIDTIAIHKAGYSEGSFRIRVVDYSQLKDNFYNITINKTSIDTITFNLINTETGDTLLKNHPLPEDEYGHNIPITDGFRIAQGNYTTQVGPKLWQYSPSSNKWFTGVRGVFFDGLTCDRYRFITYPSKWAHSIDNILSIESLRVVQLRFSNYNTQKAYRCINGFAPFPPALRNVKHPEFRPFVIDSVGSGFLYQDYEMYPLGNPAFGRTVPFTVWEVDKKTGRERQLDVMIVERNDSLYRKLKTSDGRDSIVYLYRGNIDGKWNPAPFNNMNSLYGDEMIFILNSTYSDTPKAQYAIKGNWLSREYEYQYLVWMRRMSETSTFQEGDVLEITPYFPLTQNDVFSFNPYKIYLASKIPSEYKLYNNYPNPFNTQTTIRFDIPMDGRVLLEIYNLIGQRVKTLINEDRAAGKYSVMWDGTNEYNRNVSSGVYFYRIRVNEYAETKKMVLLR